MSSVRRSQGRSSRNMGRVANRSRGRRGGLGSSASRGSGAVVNRRQPPQFDATITFSKRLRYVAGATLANDTVKDTDILQLILVADTTVSAKSIIGAAKVNHVEMWAPPAASASTPNTVALEWVPTSAIGAPARIVSDTTLGTAAPPHIYARPPPSSVAGQWLANGNQAIMKLTGPEGLIVDIDVTFVLASGAPLATGAVTVVAATAGDVFMNVLDYSGTQELAPVSYASV